MKTVEELLLPRYKVIADYFYNPYKIGDIITVLHDDRSVHLATTSQRDDFGETVNVDHYFNPARLKDYPHLFQPLPWWSDRKAEDMPAFIKCDERVWKIAEWKKDMLGRFFPVNEVETEGETKNFANIKWHFAGDKFLPATIEEYEQYKQRPQP